MGELLLSPKNNERNTGPVHGRVKRAPIKRNKKHARIDVQLKYNPSLRMLWPAQLKRNIFSAKSLSLDVDETLIALSISAPTNTTAQLAMEKLKNLQGCEVHMTHIPTPGDEAGLRRLGVNLTCEPNFSTKGLFEILK